MKLLNYELKNIRGGYGKKLDAAYYSGFFARVNALRSRGGNETKYFLGGGLVG